MVKLTAQVKTILRRAKNGRICKAEAARSLNISRKTLYTLLKGRTIRKTKKELVSRRILSIVAVNPKIGPKKISQTLINRGLNLSPKSVWQELRALNLSTISKREDFSLNFAKPRQAQDNTFPTHLRLLPDARKKMVEDRDLDSFRVSRKTYSKWNKRYQKAFSGSLNMMEALSDACPRGCLHPRGTSKETEEAILSLVVRHPEFSSHRLAAILKTVGNHGVQGILERNNLSLYEMRRAYAATQAVTPIPARMAGVFGRIKSVFETFTPNLAPAPPPKFQSILKTFFFSSFFAFTIIYGSLLWSRIIFGGGSFGAGIGLVFATVALAAGTFFFLYSLKYYLTTAILLSFSNRQRDGKLDFDSPGMNADLESVHIKKYPFVSVHVPFYNEKRVVERSIKAATNFDYPEYEVILCDDSTDETTEIIRTYQESCLFKGESLKVTRGEGWTLTEVTVRPGVTLKHLHRTTRSGYKGGALSLALKLSDPRTEFVSIFDADFVPYADSLNFFVKYFKVANNLSEDYTKSNVAAVQGYQWHVLNKSENWVTRGVRSEYAGSYVVERSGAEIYKGLKQISGSVYMIRKSVLTEVGWGTSITEDFELTLKLYNAGYKVVYTPYVQAPAECVSTLRRIIRQRMRWAEGHSFNVKLMAWKLLRNPKITFTEKLEFAYLMPYYLQAFFFLIGTFSWFLSEAVFRVRLPFWSELWGWSLVLTNMVSLPLLNAVGMFLEESGTKDYSGLGSFVALSYIIVPFQAYAAVKGLLEKKEGPWFRTPKTGRVTDTFKRSKFYKFISDILPGRMRSPTTSYAVSPYLALSTANNKYNNFKITPHKAKWIGKLALVILLIISVSIISLAPMIGLNNIPVAKAATLSNVNFSTGDLSQFAGTSTDGGKITATTGSAQMGTNYGMNVALGDNNQKFGWTTVSADTSGKIRVRFYFSTNSIGMTNNEDMILYQAYNSAGNTVATVRLMYQTSPKYRLYAQIVNDSGTSISSTVQTITDGVHMTEIYLQRATTNVSSDGSLGFWVDGGLVNTISGTGNYNRFNNYDYSYFGQCNTTSFTPTGNLYLDELVINNDGSLIGPLNGNIVYIDHEPGNFSQYSSTITNSGNLSVTTAAKLNGSYGMQALINSVTTEYGTATLGAEDTSTVFSARAYINPNSFTAANGDNFYFLTLANAAGTNFVDVSIYWNTAGNHYGLVAGLKDDASTWHFTTTYQVTNATHYIEVKVIKATNGSSNDASIQFWIDGVSKQTVSGIGCYTIWTGVKNVKFGVDGWGQYGSTAGTPYFDDLVVNDNGNYIGAVPENLWVALCIVPFIPIFLKKRRQKSEMYNFSKLV